MEQPWKVVEQFLFSSPPHPHPYPASHSTQPLQIPFICSYNLEPLIANQNVGILQHLDIDGRQICSTKTPAIVDPSSGWGDTVDQYFSIYKTRQS